MPTDMTKYPKDWPDIRNRILLRAGGDEDDPRIGARCERCGVRNYAVGWRDEDGDFNYEADEIVEDDCYFLDYESAREWANEANKHSFLPVKYIVIVLTVAHLHDPDPMNCDDDNLAALCQACHNRLDAPMRRLNRVLNTGQMALF